MQTRAKKMSAQRVQHCQYTSEEHEKQGRVVGDPTPEAKMEAPASIPALAHKPSANETHTFGDTWLKQFTESFAAEMSVEQFNMTGIRWESLQAS